MKRYPSELAVTSNDLANCRLKDILKNISTPGYEVLWLAFSKAAVEGDDIGRSKALWLLSDACAMHLNPSNKNNPFSSSITHQGWKTVDLVDFTKSDLDFFLLVTKETNNYWLNARLADLRWAARTADKLNMGAISLDNYLKIPISSDLSQDDWKLCWERAITLSLQLNKKHLQDIEHTLLHHLYRVSKQTPWVARTLSAILKKNKLARTHALTVAEKLEHLASEFNNDTDQVSIMTASSLFIHASEWFNIVENKQKSSEMMANVAECKVREGISRINSPHPCYGSAAYFYKEAISIYLDIPRQHRCLLNIEPRINTLRRMIDEASIKALSKLTEFPGTSIDIREEIEWSRQQMQNKTLSEALKSFSCIVPSFEYKSLERVVSKNLQQSSLANILPITIVDEKDGRVISHAPALDSNTFPTDEINDCRFIFEMMRAYIQPLALHVTAFILPAMDSIVQEFSLSESDFIEIAHLSSIVPHGRSNLFGKALYSGFNYDFATALHLLTPQIEHMVRYHLKKAGANTYFLDKNTGTQTENGLSSLCELSEMKLVFGEDLTFEIKTIFCSAFGLNLRNKLAHGILDDNDCQSIEATYAWWLGFKLIFNTSLNQVSE